MKSLRMALAVVLGVLSAGAASQTIYRWVDGNGRVHYTSEKPPEGAKGAALQSRISSYSGTPVVSGKAPAPAAAAARAEVKMYSTDWCGYCRQAREYFARNGIRYTEVDIEKSAAARSEYERLGGRGVPVILVGAQRMNGFSEPSMSALLKSAGY
jgi:glutaredoxin